MSGTAPPPPLPKKVTNDAARVEQIRLQRVAAAAKATEARRRKKSENDLIRSAAAANIRKRDAAAQRMPRQDSSEEDDSESDDESDAEPPRPPGPAKKRVAAVPRPREPSPESEGYGSEDDANSFEGGDDDPADAPPPRKRLMTKKVRHVVAIKPRPRTGGLKPPTTSQSGAAKNVKPNHEPVATAPPHLKVVLKTPDFGDLVFASARSAATGGTNFYNSGPDVPAHMSHLHTNNKIFYNRLFGGKYTR